MNNFLRSSLLLFTLAFALPALADDGQPKYLFQLAYSDAEEAISKALAEKGAGAKIAATINGHKSEPIFSYNKPLNVELRGLQFDKPTSRWSASLLFISEENTISAVPVSGRFDEVVEVPVLKRQIHSGEVIADADIDYHDFPTSHMRNDCITDVSKLIGKSPVRTISPNRPVRELEIATPAIVKKNALVEMRYSMPGMEITTNGQAMGDGAKGDVISVRNINSRKLVRATIEDDHTVTILPAGPPTQANNAIPTSSKVMPYAAN